MTALLLVLLVWAGRAEAFGSGLAHYASTLLSEEPNRQLQDLAKLSDAEDSLARTYLSPAHRKAALQLVEWMEDAGMESWIDAVGNVHGRINGSFPNSPALVLGSHYDTVLDGGKYDGALGIIVGIAAIKATVVEAALKAGIQLPDLVPGQQLVLPPGVAARAAKAFHVPVRLVAFADEEGVRFQSTFLGSRALVGSLVKHGMLKSADKQGHSLEQVLREEGGIEGDVEEALRQVAIPANRILEYLEVHIEQGPVLEAEAKPLGVVSGIAGQTRLWLVINGTQGHAGTVPMVGRRDSLAAAAAVVSAIEAACGGGPGAVKDPSQEMLVCTVGELRVWPGASNVIAGSTQLSVDIRAKHDALRLSVVQQVTDQISALCDSRGVSCELRRTHDAGAVLSDERMVRRAREAILAAQPVMAEDLGLAAAQEGLTPEEIPVIVSGAGHDGLAMAEVSKVAMVFVRCRGGVSHSPLEHVEPEDTAAATAALWKYVSDLALTPQTGKDEL